MLDVKRIEIAKRNFNQDIKDGYIRKQRPDDNLINALKNNANESLGVANFLFEEDISPLWVIVSSYYSMYYMSNAVLNKLGFKVGDQISHRVTADALIVLVRDKLKSRILQDYDKAKEEYEEIDNLTDEIIELYDLEHKKRLNSQYVMGYEVRISKSNTSLNRAKKFVLELEKTLLEL
ncbi:MULTISPECIES: hypothetical protein [Methanobacterium]|uniref:HEPN domain-containing protein n=1 Tax=Methanobacterium veterum TaxID=408577 RepID=A0A9E5A1M0_9EURY|nr:MULTISPECIES: hypothetical protein [Methanobacterium]MCZ3366395.1 hypothetical protein [Methanobacterium veterum]MCZ3371903.1 hypothetical protein [Methanobacterium veterum]